jgi:hypothetical protein
MQASSHLHQPPQTPVGMGDGGTFADAANLDHCAKYLNQTLVTFGFPASLDLFATDPVRHSLPLDSLASVTTCWCSPQTPHISCGLCVFFSQPFSSHCTLFLLVSQLNCGCLILVYNLLAFYGAGIGCKDLQLHVRAAAAAPERHRVPGIDQ